MKATDVLLAILIFLVLAALYALTMQERVYGDGMALIATFRASEDFTVHWIHPLTLPVAQVLQGLPFEDSLRGLRAESALCAALGTALTYVLCRLFEMPRVPSFLACALLAVSPALWFYATTIEVHALHYAAVALVACATLSAPWRRFALALAITAALAPLLYLSHRSGPLLLPGWLYLVHRGATRAGAPLSPRRLVLLVGPVLLGVTAVTILAVNLTQDVGAMGGAESFILRVFSVDFSPRIVLDAWLFPLAVVGVLGVLGLATRHWTHLDRAGFGVLLLPSLVFFLAWGIAERGAYFLPSAVFLAVLAASLPWERLRGGTLPVMGALLALQGSLAWAELSAYANEDLGPLQEARIGAVREALGRKGILLSFEPELPNVQSHLPQILEINLLHQLARAWKDVTPEEYATDVVRLVRDSLELGEGKVALDLGYLRVMDRARELIPYLRAIESRLRDELSAEERTSGSWTVLVLRLRDDAP